MIKKLKKTPPKWYDIYAQGTPHGNEEQKFFIAIARHPKYAWRSIASIAKETGLSKERIEEIIQKYYSEGMLFSHENGDKWAYWERVPELLEEPVSITKQDQEERMSQTS